MTRIKILFVRFMRPTVLNSGCNSRADRITVINMTFRMLNWAIIVLCENISLPIVIVQLLLLFSTTSQNNNNGMIYCGGEWT